MVDSLQAVISDREALPEVRLWRMVIASTIQDWVSGPLVTSRQAEEYLLSNKSDFRLVCESAEMDADFLRSRLLKLRRQVTARPQTVFSEYAAQ